MIKANKSEITMASTQDYMKMNYTDEDIPGANLHFKSL